jgi:4-diphosphocytidyl-2-C-methyl-D-erythritol kinase
VISSALAPAKVNLFLHVGPLAADGYHPLSSLVVFADAGDHVSVSLAETPEFLVEGPFAVALAGEADNLVLQAVRGLERAADVAMPPLRILLRKELPVAAGLGGGSSDAGAALKTVDDLLGLGLAEEMLEAIAAGLGADGPMCLKATPALAEDRGDRLSPAPGLPPVHAVLVNPGVPSPTGAVYRAYDDAGAPGGADRPTLPDRFETVEDLAAFLAGCRNDLEAPAVALAPEIGTVLDVLKAEPETLFARMSGSGATCFALCEGELEARSLTARLERERPGWWIRPCRLGGPWV